MKTRFGLNTTALAALSIAAVLASAGAASAQAPPAGLPPGMAPPADAPPIKSPPPGPYAVTVEAAPGLPTHTVYRPTDLSKFSGASRLPVIAWGNGACATAGLAFETFLRQVASHGYFVVVAGRIDTPLPDFSRLAIADAARPGGQPPGAPPGLPPGMPPPGSMGPQAKDADLKTALDWAVAQNRAGAGAYAGKLNPDAMAVMGQSCGGLMAIANAADPRVKTTVVWNSGTFPDAAGPAGMMSSASKASLATFHSATAYFSGGPTDIAQANALDDVSRIQGVPLFHGWINVGHGGTYMQPGGGRFGEVGVAWLDWRLKGDKAAGKMFQGPDCTLCRDPIWHVTKKNIS